MKLFLIFGLAILLGNALEAFEGLEGQKGLLPVERLVPKGPESLKSLRERLSKTDWRGREKILEMMAHFGPESLIFLTEIARSHIRIDAQRLAILSLGKVGGLASRDSLMSLINSPNRDLVLEALGIIGGPAIAQKIVPFLDDEVPVVRSRAVIALGKSSGMKAMDQIINALSDPHHSVRFAAAGALEEIGLPAAKALLQRVDQISGKERYLMFQVLGRLRYNPARDLFLRALNETDWAIRAVAVEALGGLEGVTGIFEEALSVEIHPFVREMILLQVKREK